VVLSGQQRARLEAIVRAPTSQVRLVRRARIVLACAAGRSAPQVAQELGCNVNTVRLWRGRFLGAGLTGLQDRPGRGRKPVYVGEQEARIVAETLKPPPDGTTHWSARRLARHLGMSKSTVHRVWRAHRLQPHRVKTFKFSRDPLLVEKTVDIVGLYLNPPDKALVLCADEKSQIQALERSQPLLPLAPNKTACHTPDYARHGTTTLFAALNQATGEVVGRCARRQRHQEFLAFLRLVDRTYPHGDIHLILDNYATHTHPAVERWFARRLRFVRHFTPTGCSWVNLVEVWFSILTRQRVRRGSFTSVTSLIRSLHDYLQQWDAHPTPFRWTKTVAHVLKPYKLPISGTEH